MRTPIILVLGLDILLLVAGCGLRSADERDLRLRLKQYEQYWASQRYDEVWKLMSQRLRDGNNNDESSFAKMAQGSGATLVRLDIRQIQIAGDGATVRAVATFHSASDARTRQEVQEQHWIKAGGKWLFDDYRSIQ